MYSHAPTSSPGSGAGRKAESWADGARVELTYLIEISTGGAPVEAYEDKRKKSEIYACCWRFDLDEARGPTRTGGCRVEVPVSMAKEKRALKRAMRHRDVPVPQLVGMDEQPKEDPKAVVDDAIIGNSRAEFRAGFPGRRKWNDESEARRLAMNGRSNEDEEKVSLVPAPSTSEHSEAGLLARSSGLEEVESVEGTDEEEVAGVLEEEIIEVRESSTT